MSPRLRTSFWLLLCALASTLPLGWAHAQQAKVIESPAASQAVVVARVNGRPITEAQVEFLRISRGITEADASAARASLIETLIDSELIREFLSKKRVVVAEADLVNRKARFIDQWKTFGYDLPEQVKAWGLPEAVWVADISLPLQWYVYSKSQITDAAIQAEYARDPKRWNGTRLRARQLVIRWPERKPDAATREKIAGIARRVAAGELTFTDAIAQHSESPTATKGGDVGWFGWRGRLPAAVSTAAYAQKVGEVGPPVESPVGIHLIEVTEVRPGELSVEDARPEIFDELSQRMWNEVVTTGRDTAMIERLTPTSR